MDEAKFLRSQKTSTESEISFEHCTIVACGTLSLELNQLKKSGFLNAGRIEYTKPGRHEVPGELEQQLVERIGRASPICQHSCRVQVIPLGGTPRGKIGRYIEVFI